MSQFFDHSNRMKELVETGGKSDLWALIEDRFAACPEGKSFSVDKVNVPSEAALRSLISRRAKAAKKIFRVVKHTTGDQVVYEIARFADERHVIGDPVPNDPRQDGWATDGA